LAIVLFVLSFGHCIVYPLRKDRQYNGQKEGQTIQWPKERTDITLAKRKDRQYTGQKKGQKIQCPKERTNNTMAKRKDRQYNGQKEGQTIQWPKERIDITGQCIVCPFF
jgi:hypothetical protein